MSGVPTTHPSERLLSDYRQGRLTDPARANVAAHLRVCPTCRRAAQGLIAPPADAGNTRLPSAGETRRPEPAFSRPLPADLPPGLAATGKFEVLGKVGQGGMGSVWKARHLFLDCLVAIKVMGEEITRHPEARDRFLREMRAAGKLQHPHIVRALDAEPVGDLLILVMEYVDGISLDRLVAQKGPLPIAFACRCATQAADGLQFACERGMVHRDVKPANLMLTAQDRAVKILDFGLVRLNEDTGPRNRTRLQTFMGTPEYVAPEQATDAATADIRADIYGLGCTLFFLLTGRPPFQADSVMNTILLHLEQAPPDPRQLRPEVPAELAAVIGRMLAKKPAERYQTPQEVVHALQPFVSGPRGGESTAPPPPLPADRPEEATWASVPPVMSERPRKRAREKKGRSAGRWAIGAAALMFLAAAACLVAWMTRPGEKKRAEGIGRPAASPVSPSPDWEFLGTRRFSAADPLLDHPDIPSEMSAEYKDGQGRFWGTRSAPAKVILGTERGHFGTALLWKVSRAADATARFVVRPAYNGHERSFSVALYRADGVFDSGQGGYTGRLLGATPPFDLWANLDNHLDVLFETSTRGVDVRLNGTSLLKGPISLAAGTPVLLCLAATSRYAGDVCDTRFTLRRGEVAEKDRWRSLFNGKDLAGWKVVGSGPDTWSVGNGALTGEGPPSHGHLFSERGDYGNFHLRAELRINDGGLGVLGFRTRPTSGCPEGYAVQLTSNHRVGGTHKTGSLFVCRARPGVVLEFGEPLSQVEAMHVRPGDWFRLEVLAEGNHLRVAVNSMVVTDVTDAENSYPRGHLSLLAVRPQHLGSETRVRKVEIKELP